jgi:hypothetical protein
MAGGGSFRRFKDMNVQRITRRASACAIAAAVSDMILRRSRLRAFGFVELLVVIAIIAILPAGRLSTAFAAASLTPLGIDSVGNGVSGDGAVAVGVSGGYGGQAFRWTAAGGMQGLGDLPGGAFSSGAGGVSGDGSVIVGTGASAAGAGTS